MFYAQATICDAYFVESIKATASGFLALCGVKRCLGEGGNELEIGGGRHVEDALLVFEEFLAISLADLLYVATRSHRFRLFAMKIFHKKTSIIFKYRSDNLKRMDDITTTKPASPEQMILECPILNAQLIPNPSHLCNLPMLHQVQYKPSNRMLKCKCARTHI